jgi:predicted transcriptional regulator
MDDSSGDTTVLALTARVVAAHVGHNAVSAGDLPHLIRLVYEILTNLGPTPSHGAPHAEAQHDKDSPVPAVPPEKSVFNDYVICLEDGKKQKTLKRHLQSAHGLSPEAYRARWGLPPSYPMVAPDYAERRSVLAKSIGLGTKRIPTS